MGVELGSVVRCRVTGFTGVATHRVETIDGVVDVGVTYQKAPDGKYPSPKYINESRLEVVEPRLVEPSDKKDMGFFAPRR